MEGSIFLRRELHLGILLLFLFGVIYITFFGSGNKEMSLSKEDERFANLYATNKRLLSKLKAQQDILVELKQSLFGVNLVVKEMSSSDKNTLSNMQTKLDRVLDTVDKMLVPKYETSSPLPISTKKGHHIQEQDENYRHIRLKELNKLELDLEEVMPLEKPPISEMHDKWIVVTSIFKPSDDIQKLANIPGWKLVVVGDKKTPKDWK